MRFVRGLTFFRKRVLVTTGALTLVVAAPAMAGLDIDVETDGPVTYVTAEIGAGGVPEGSSQTIIAGCPGETKLAGLGGSFRSGGAGGETIFNALHPYDGDDENTRADDAVRMRGVAVSEVGNITAQAACTAEQPRIPEKRVVLKEEAGKTVSVPCPRGTFVSGGGGQMTGDPDYVRVHSTSPYDDGDTDARPDDGWRVRAYNLTDGRLQIFASAICLGERPRYQETEYELDSGIGLGTSACKRGGALSVGARTEAPAGVVRLVAVELTDSAEINGGDADTAPDDFANVHVSSDTDDTKQLTVTLICGP